MTESHDNLDPQPEGTFTCANCYADFAWEPFERGGDIFCCGGCADGGPCICTYVGPAPSLSSETPAEEASSQAAASTSHATTGSSRAIVLAAVSELPAELRRVVELRVTREINIDEIARELGLDTSEVERRIAQGESILRRILGSDFQISYMPGVETSRAAQQPPTSIPELPDEDSGVTPFEPAAPAEPDISSLISTSLSALTRPLLGRGQVDDSDTEDAQSTIREALREASELFRLAAQRLETSDEQARTLREMLRDEPADEITLSVEGISNTSEYTHTLEAIDSIERVWLESVENGHAIYKLQARTVSAVVRGLLGLEGELRPHRLRVLGDEIRATVGGAVPVTTGGGRPMQSGPVYELGADAFFGARHFVTMNGVQGPPHHHSYRVEVLMESEQQSDDGVVMGFGEARSLIESIVMDYNETLLNTVPPFDETQPTSENIARVIYERLAAELAESPIRLKQVRVWKSQTNSASYSDVALAR